MIIYSLRRNLFKILIFASILLFGIIGIQPCGNAQGFQDIKLSDDPLILKDRGSFFVGGENVEQTYDELGSFATPGHISVNQMYVEYMIPVDAGEHVPVVMIHGMALTGKTWDTTPDSRMGWYEYFVRNGHPSFVVDQVSRGRSGFNQAIFNNIRVGNIPPDSLPVMRRFSNENVWQNFRIGTKLDSPLADTKFPTEALDEFAKQGVPDLNSTLPSPNPNYRALATLADQLNGAVLISHSQSGAYPLEAALIDEESVKGVVMVEPGGCPSGYFDEEFSVLAQLPMLIMFGDYLDNPTGTGSHTWDGAHDGCLNFLERVNSAGGRVRMMYLPDEGIPGSSHMIMQDINNLEIADMVLQWVNDHIKD